MDRDSLRTSFAAVHDGQKAAEQGPLTTVALRKLSLRLRVGLLCFCLFAFSGNRVALTEESARPINLPAQIGERIARCWQAPQTDPPQIIEVTVRLSFSRTGEVIGEPRVVYIRGKVDAILRQKISASVLAAVKACTPLPFTPALGAAIAGRMFAIRFNSLPLTGRQRFT